MTGYTEVIRARSQLVGSVVPSDAAPAERRLWIASVLLTIRELRRVGLI